MHDSTESNERLCWSSWPCAACSGGVTPINHLFGGIETGAVVSESSPEEIATGQSKYLLEWATRCEHQKAHNFSRPKLAEGSEHLVFLDEETARVFKITRTGTFGESYFLEDGKIAQKNCSPLEYLIRLRLWKELFGSAPADIGITTRGQIISSQPFIKGTPPAQSEVDDFLLNSGFAAVKQQYWLWKKSYKTFEIWLGDARMDNFVKTTEGLVPIDIRIWLCDVK